MASILILGGTAWLGRTAAATALAGGHEVTCLARGDSGVIAEGATLVAVDRSRSDAYDAVTDREWDLVLDVSRQPGQVRSALAALAEQARRWVFVSTVSVYADNSQPGDDESAALLPALTDDEATAEQYGEGKVACENACRDAIGERLLIVRAGLIAGYGDPSDRFGYWPARFDRDPEAAVLVPERLDRSDQAINVRTLASWLIDAGLAGHTGTVNAVGAQRSLGDVINACRAATGHTGELVAASDEWLLAHNVDLWMGPRSLPLWLAGPEYAGFTTRDGSAAATLGLRDDSLPTLVADALAWEREQDPDRQRRAGLTDAEHAELLSSYAGPADTRG